MSEPSSRLQAALGAARRVVHSNVPDMLLLVGGGLLSYGAGLAYRPAGFITAGLLLLAAGVLASRGSH